MTDVTFVILMFKDHDLQKHLKSNKHLENELESEKKSKICNKKDFPKVSQ